MRTAAISLVALLALTAAGCAGPDATPTASPSGDPFEQPHGERADGPVAAVGDGSSFDTGWRYAMYPSDGAWCAQIDVDGAIDARCDAVLPADGEVLGSVGVRISDGTGATVVDVIATTEVATVWLIAGPTARVPATGMPLPEGVEGQAWVGVLPADGPPTHLQAVAFNGQVLETIDLRR